MNKKIAELSMGAQIYLSQFGVVGAAAALFLWTLFICMDKIRIRKEIANGNH